MDETRRRLLAVLGTTPVAALAGCLGGDSEGTSGDDESGGDGGSDQSEESALPLQQQTKLVPDDGDDGDAFGGSVAMASDGSTAIVGANGDEEPNGESAGSAYVFA